MKAKLLAAIDEGRARETELVGLVVDEPADPDGRWHAKDHLAHLSWWRWRSANNLEAVRTGGELPAPVDDDDAVTNAIVYAEIKDRPVAGIKADAHDSWAALRNAVEKSSEEDLSKPHPQFPQTQVWEVVPGAIGHSGTHLWSWYLDIGEEARAMAAARRTAEVEGSFFTKPEQLAESRYNLACVYGRLGMAKEALRLLRESFAARPDLIALARKDTDLDRIREDPAVKHLLSA